MADTDILKVLLQLENPELLNKLEDVKKGFTVKIRGDIDKGLQDILSTSRLEKQIKITADDKGALSVLNGIKNTLESIQKQTTLSVKFSGDPVADLQKINKLMGEIQAKQLLPQLSQLGAVQNNNVKTLSTNAFQPGGSLDQAKVIKAIQDEANKQLAIGRAQAVNPNRGVELDSSGRPIVVIGTTNQTKGPNLGEFVSTRGGSEDTRDLITLQREQRRKQQLQFESQEAARLQAEQAAELVKRKSEEDFKKSLRLDKFISSRSGPISIEGQGVSARVVAARRAEDEAIEQEAKAAAEARLKRTQKQQEAINKFQQSIASSSNINDERKRQEAIDAYREATAPFSLLSDRPTGGNSSVNRRLAALAPQQGGGTNVFGSQLGHIGLGILAGQAGGAVRGTASLLGGVAGSTFGPIGASVGSLVGGALFEGAAKSVEFVTHVFEDVARSGIEFQSTIVALTGVLQANTDAFDSSGNKLDAFAQTRASQAQARAIQQAARSELLPLGISGDTEATLVQGLFSGASQRGIVLDSEQTKTISGRLGAAIVSLVPQLLQNPVQARRDTEDIFANSPNAGRTTLGVALKNIAPDLFRSLASGDDLVKATEKLEKFKEAIKNSDQAAVQLLRLSGAVGNLKTSLGDSFLQALQPAIKVLADIAEDENFAKAITGFGKALGGLVNNVLLFTTALGKAATDIAQKFPFLKGILDSLVQAGTPDTLPKGNTKPKPEIEIARFLREAGIDSIGEFEDSTIRSDPRFKLNKLQQAERATILAQNGDLEQRFLPGIFFQELAAARGATQADAGRIDTFTFQGRRDAAEATLRGTAVQRQIGEKALSFATNNFNNALASGDEGEAFRQAGIINKINDDLAQTAKDSANASRELITATLDETRALQGLRNATESVKDAQFNQAKQLNELNRSLAAAKDEVEQFGRKAASAFASKEEQIIDANIEVAQAGGVAPLGNLETLQSLKKDARLQSASTKLNELLGETGVGSQVDARGGQGLIGPNSIFSNALEREKQALEDSVDKIIYELDRLPRALRDAIESLNDLAARTGLQFGQSPDEVKRRSNELLNIPSGSSTDLREGEQEVPGSREAGSPMAYDPTSKKIRPLQGGIFSDAKTIPGFLLNGKSVLQNYPGDYDSNGSPIPVRGDGGDFSISMGPLGATNAILGGAVGIPTDISSGLFNSDGAAQPIPNASDVTNASGSPFYSAIVGGLQNSKLRNNIRPQAPSYYNEQTPGGIPFGGSKVTTESSIQPAIKELVDTLKQQGDKLADDIRKGIESSFGSGR